MKEYDVDVLAAASWQNFIDAFNEGFVRLVGGAWHGNLDAFNDYLSWPDEHPYRLVFRGWWSCAPAVNRHRGPDQRPVLQIIAEIIQDNPLAQVTFIESDAPINQSDN